LLLFSPKPAAVHHVSQAIKSLRYVQNNLLSGTVQSLAEGQTLCLQVLVETEAWKYAPDDIVNEICLRVTGALEEKGTQTNSHMKLFCSLAKSNSPILEAYERSLLKSVTKILETGVVTGNSQQRLHAVLMINGLLKFVVILLLFRAWIALR
jgi:hypothetical protein